MQTSPAGLAFIAKNEGTCLTIKPDNRGPQIGHGHDLTPIECQTGIVYGIPIEKGITEKDADHILIQDMNTIYDPALARMLPSTAAQNQWNAMADFIYNEGQAHLATLLHHGWSQVTAQLPAWVYGLVDGVETKIPALVARRTVETALFNS